jgi:hypothetical protein
MRRFGQPSILPYPTICYIFSGLFDYFATKEKHRKRLKEILDEFPKGWWKRIDEALKKSGLELPI